MKRTFLVVLSTVLLFCGPAFAATVDSVKGKVLINRGDGFQPATSGTNANAGDLLMANAGGSAKLIYPGGCQVSIIPGRVVSVGKQPPCTAPVLGRGRLPRGFLQQSSSARYCGRGDWMGHLLRRQILP